MKTETVTFELPADLVERLRKAHLLHSHAEIARILEDALSQKDALADLNTTFARLNDADERNDPPPDHRA